MIAVAQAALVLGAAVAMEPVSAAIHRRFGHGKGWFLHRSHHESPVRGPELNDVIPAVSAVLTMVAFWLGVTFGSLAWLVPLAAGVTLYGSLYFLLHDIYIHRRLPLLPARISWLEPFKAAHLLHHETGTGHWGILSRPPRSASLQAELR